LTSARVPKPHRFLLFLQGTTASVSRPIWRGTISFGPVSVPVRVFSATDSKELRFHFLHKQNGKRTKKQRCKRPRAKLPE